MKRWYGTPRRFAARLTALRSSPGRRMLIRASLGENSNCVRSLLATNRSASLSLLSRGSFARVLALRFIMLDLLGVHEPGANGADEAFLPDAPIREGDKDVTIGGRLPASRPPSVPDREIRARVRRVRFRFPRA